MTENTIDASIVDEVGALLAADRAGAAPLPASNQYADVVRAVARARLALKSRPTRGAIYAKIRGELDAPHVLLRAPLRRPSGTPSPERGSPPGRGTGARACFAQPQAELEPSDAAFRIVHEHV